MPNGGMLSSSNYTALFYWFALTYKGFGLSFGCLGFFSDVWISSFIEIIYVGKFCLLDSLYFLSLLQTVCCLSPFWWKYWKKEGYISRSSTCSCWSRKLLLFHSRKNPCSLLFYGICFTTFMVVHTVRTSWSVQGMGCVLPKLFLQWGGDRTSWVS